MWCDMQEKNTKQEIVIERTPATLITVYQEYQIPEYPIHKSYTISCQRNVVMFWCDSPKM